MQRLLNCTVDHNSHGPYFHLFLRNTQGRIQGGAKGQLPPPPLAKKTGKRRERKEERKKEK